MRATIDITGRRNDHLVAAGGAVACLGVYEPIQVASPQSTSPDAFLSGVTVGFDGFRDELRVVVRPDGRGRYARARLEAVEGDVANLINFIMRLKDDFVTGAIKSVDIKVSEGIIEENSSASIQLLLYTYQGD